MPRGYSRKNARSWWYTFLKKNLSIFRFATLPLEILEKTSFQFHLWKFCKIVTHTLFGNSRVKNQAQDPWRRFHISFSWTALEIPLLFKLTPGIFTSSYLLLDFLSSSKCEPVPVELRPISGFETNVATI